MIQDIALRVRPEVAADREALVSLLSSHASLGRDAVNDFRIVRRSVDARQRQVMVNVTLRVATGCDMKVTGDYNPVEFRDVTAASPAVVIVGAGPAGLFAALRALELGMRPVVLERGRGVDERRIDIAALCRTRTVDSDSNYCFGEGGAGAFSDGKLYTRSD